MSQRSNRELFEAALSLAPESREAWLASAASGPAQRAQVWALLSAAEAPSDLSLRVQRAADQCSRDSGWSERLGPYRLIELLGEGGMGMVWKAERVDGEYQHLVAIKTLRGRASPAAVERLRDERQILASLIHPNIARLLDGGTTPAGEPYLVMDHVEGLPLAEWLHSERPDLATRLRLFATLCRAVEFAHQRLVVHCDIKPGNVLVRSDGSPVLLDFGVAQLMGLAEHEAAPRSFAGTPAYASPEQLLGQPVTLQSDVFGLGMLLLEHLCGARPESRFDGEGRPLEAPAASRLAARAQPNPERAALALPAQALRGDLDSILAKALRVEASQRYASAGDMASDIEAWLEHRPVSARGGHWRYLLAKALRRHRVAVTLGAAALLALLLLSIGLLQQFAATRAALEVAETRQRDLQSSVEFLTGMFAEFDPNVAPGQLLSPQALADLTRTRLDAMRALPDGTRLELTRSLGQVYNNIGANDAALEMNQRVLALISAKPSSAAELAAAQLGVAVLLERLGRVKESLAMARQAEANSRATTDLDLQAEALLSLGLSLQGNADAAAAEASYAQSAARFAQLPDGQSGLSKVTHNRAQLALFNGQPERALALYREAASLKLALADPDHPTMFPSRLGEIQALGRLGRYAEALDLLEDLAPRVERMLGKRSDRYTVVQMELGSVLQDLGRFDQSRAAYLEALASLRAAGIEDMNLARTLNNLASLDEARGDTASALAGYRESLMLRERLGADPVSLARVRMNMARTLIDASRLDEAQPLLAESAAVRKQLLPAAHPDQNQARVLVLLMAIARGDQTEVETRMQVLRLDLAAQSPTLSAAMRGDIELSLARAALALGRSADAEALATQALASREQAFPADHPAVARARLLLARAHLGAGHAELARSELARAAAVLEARLVVGAPGRRELQQTQAELLVKATSHRDH